MNSPEQTMEQAYALIRLNIPLDQEFTYAIPEGMTLELGQRVQVPFGHRDAQGLVLGFSPNPPLGVEPKRILKVIGKESLFGPHTLELAQWLAKFTFSSLGETLFSMLPSAKREKALEEWETGEEPGSGDLELSEEQSAAVKAILQKDTRAFYLTGITGSGKTEVFLQAAKSVMAQGKSVIYLVPEIALTWQLVQKLKQRLGDSVAVLHSGLTPSQRLKEWVRLKSGQARMALGARSAVFAPLSDLGLIIIDEEHEGSYKSSNTPRFHARQAAFHLSSLTNAVVVMGSATPSLEAIHQIRTGKLTALPLTKRLAGGQPPQITLVDMKKESGLLSKPLLQALRRVKDLGRQSILFLNRRGFSYFFHCRTCGHELRCRQCSVALTYHKNKDRLICHWCGYQAPARSLCPECGSLDVGYAGFGTQHVEEEARRLFPDLRTARVDSDTAEKKDFVKQTIMDFEKGNLDLLIGTQMVAKGLNFPGLKLVGLVLADTGLALPDFRSSERTYSLIRQVAGRAGRFHPDGEVYVQTWRPDHPLLKLAKEGRDEDFFTWELENRKTLGFPPFTRLIRFVFRSKNPLASQNAAQSFAGGFMAFTQGKIDLLGPSPAPLSLVAGNTRTHVILRSPDMGLLHQAASAWLKLWKVPSNVYLECDPDPLHLA